MFSYLRMIVGTWLLISLAGRLAAQTTAFTYQGRLTDGGQPANGTYDLTLSLYATNLSGSPLGIVTNQGVAVAGGLFTVTPNFGPGVFGATNYWLEIAVRTNHATAFLTLSPRQSVTPAPLALYAASAASAASAVTAGSVAATNISGVIASAALPYGILSNFVAAGIAPWTNQVTGSNLTASGGVNLTPEVWVFTNGTYYAGGVWYHSTDNVVQDAIDHLPVGSLLEPGGGVVELGSGTFFVNDSISIHQTNPFTIELRGQGQTATAIVGTMNGPVLSIGSSNGTRINLEIDHLCCASTVNTYTNIVEIGDTTPASVEVRHWSPEDTGGVANMNIHDCYFGPWDALTNNESIGVFEGFSTTSTGVSDYVPRLVPIWVQSVLSDNYTIRNCHFFETVAVYLACDHCRVENNNFYYMGQNNDWPNTSAFSLGSAIIFSHYNPNDAWFTYGNHFYGCNGGIFCDSGTGNGISLNDFYESCDFSVATTPDTGWTLVNVNGAGTETVGDYPFYDPWSAGNASVQTVKWGQGPVVQAESLSVADGNVTVTGTRFPVKFNLFSGGTASANGTYVRSGAEWTNAASGTRLKYDADAQTFEIYSNRTALYQFASYGKNFDAGFYGSAEAGAEPAPYCVVASMMTNVAVTANGTFYG